MISFHSNNKFENSLRYLNKLDSCISKLDFKKYGKWGVEVLSAATPKLTGLASSSWSYVVEKSYNSATLTWTNTDIEGGYNVAILIQYGHGTKDGSYVQGIDFINPALAPTFDKIAEDMWKEVTKL